MFVESLKQQLAAAWQNIRLGARLVFFLRLEQDRFRISLDLAVLLVLIDVVLSFIRDLAYSLPDARFNPFGFPAATFSYLGMLFAIYLVNRIILRQDRVLPLYVIVASSFPAVLLVHLLLYEGLRFANLMTTLPWLYMTISVLWLASIFYRATSLFAPSEKRRPILSLPVFFAAWILPSWFLVGNINYWYPDTDRQQSDPYADYRQLDVEAMYYAQPALLEQSLAGLKPQRKGKTDLYFIGFAGWARQDVFIKEVRYVQGLFDQRFDTQGRSLSLINNLQTYQSQPLATATNLQRALKEIGRRMDREEDILVLFMTSHGARSHKLSVDFWPMRLNDVEPGELKRYLDEAKIKWRVLFVSACYSGGFVDKLKDEHTFIATASAADRQSFGCGDENDFTYFGEALFSQQLTRRDSFVEAFEQARETIRQREQVENMTPSQPQLHVGEKIRSRLEQLAKRLGQEERVYPVQVRGTTHSADCESAQQSCD